MIAKFLSVSDTDVPWKTKSSSLSGSLTLWPSDSLDALGH